MSKELEALGLVKRTCEIYIDTTRFLKGSDIIANQIKEALKTIQNRLESIDNAKPSEALEDLHKVASKVELADNDDYWEVRNSYAKVENALLKAQEQEKVLSIIKEKRVDIESFYKTFIEDDFNYLDYQIMYGTYGLELLAEEEFDLLKRWLG